MSFEFVNILTGSLAGLAVAGAAACGTEILQLRKRLGGLESRPEHDDGKAGYQAVAGRLTSLQSSINALQSGLAEVQQRVAEIEQRPVENGLAVAAVAAGGRTASRAETEIPAAPINLNRRGQLLRMHRRGESIPAIASALGISQGEVKLTIRMQELYSEMPEKENSQDRL